jgi:hypothetical protein
VRHVAASWAAELPSRSDRSKVARQEPLRRNSHCREKLPNRRSARLVSRPVSLASSIGIRVALISRCRRAAQRPSRRIWSDAQERTHTMMTTMTGADRQIRDAVTRHLAWEPGLDASIVVVSTRDGVVTLSGYVERCAAKTVAERIANEVFGVRAVVNDLEVRVGLHRIDPKVTRETVEALRTHGDGRPALSVAVDYLLEVRVALDTIAVRHTISR